MELAVATMVSHHLEITDQLRGDLTIPNLPDKIELPQIEKNESYVRTKLISLMNYDKSRKMILNYHQASRVHNRVKYAPLAVLFGSLAISFTVRQIADEGTAKSVDDIVLNDIGLYGTLGFGVLAFAYNNYRRSLSDILNNYLENHGAIRKNDSH